MQQGARRAVSRRPVIAIVGGGVSAPRLCEVLAGALTQMPELELRLSARRPDRLAVLTRHTRARLARLRSAWTVEGDTDLAVAAADADLVVLLVRVGGLEARAWDESFPRRFGLVGDEGLGPGGIANAWRTVPELEQIADTLRRVAPQTRVLNLMGPLGITTRLLLDRKLYTYGLCELPDTTVRFWLSRLDRSAETPTWHYGGLNHLGWFWNFHVGRRDALAQLADALRSGDPYPVDRATLDEFQAAPLRYFYQIFRPELALEQGLVRSSNRARELRELSERLIAQFEREPGSDLPPGTRPTPWLERAVAPVSAALLGGVPHHGFVNVINADLLPELPPELVIEVAAIFDRNGVSPIKPGPLPPPVARFLAQAGRAESLAYQASITRNGELLEATMRSLPLAISSEHAKELALLAQQTPQGGEPA
jgi:6-phospho-beta-glucosidase